MYSLVGQVVRSGSVRGDNAIDVMGGADTKKLPTDYRAPREWKETIVERYTKGCTRSLRAMDQNELHAFFHDEFWKEVNRPPSAEARRAQREIDMRWKIGYVLRDKGYIDASLCSMPLFEAANTILQRRFKVSIHNAKYNELRKILGVIQNRW